jgi:hypothetical protein
LRASVAADRGEHGPAVVAGEIDCGGEFHARVTRGDAGLFPVAGYSRW